MDDNATASRMRNNLYRNYGIKVFQIGRPILCIRIPKQDLADFDRVDADAVHDRVRSNMGQMRPAEIKDLFIISDSDYLILNPDVVFKPIRQETGSVEFENTGTVEVTTEEPVGPEIEEPVEVITEELVEPEIEEPVEVITEEPVGSEIEEPVVVKAEDAIGAKTEKHEKIRDTLNQDQVVGKILNDFARNGQKKKLAVGRLKSGRRAEVLTKSKRGRYVRFRMPGEKITDIAIAPTVRAAAHHAENGCITIKKGDMREKIRRRRVSTLINIVFDTSGSMDEQDKIRITTGVVLALLKDAYQRRDRVSLVTYSGRSAEHVLPFTSSVEAAKRYLENVPFGGTTPMASGLLVSLDILLRELKKEPSAVPIMVLVTDGSANVPLNIGGNIKREVMEVCSHISNAKINVLVVDISDTRSDLAVDVSHKCRGRYYHPGSLSKESLYNAIKEERDDTAGYAAKSLVMSG